MFVRKPFFDDNYNFLHLARRCRISGIDHLGMIEGKITAWINPQMRALILVVFVATESAAPIHSVSGISVVHFQTECGNMFVCDWISMIHKSHGP